MNISIRLTEEEKAIAENYAMRHEIPLDKAFKRIEDEHDAIVAKEAYEEYVENPRTYSHEEMREILGLV